MTLTDLVPSLEVCQKLQAVGFPQDTALVWANSPQGWISGGGWRVDNGVVTTIPLLPLDGYVNVVMAVGAVNALHTVLCAAPTAEEILKELPWSIQPWLPAVEHASLQVVKSPDGFRVHWFTWDNEHEIPLDDDAGHHEKESEAAALAYLWWKEQK
jgi:hypothetical protein